VLALKPKEHGLSSSAVACRDFGRKLTGCGLALAAFGAAAPLVAQGAGAGTPLPPAATPAPSDRINLLVTRPRGEVNQGQIQECEDRADAGAISGEIVVCRQIGEDPANLFSNPEEARRRYAEATANKNSPPPPNVFGIGNHGNSIGFGSVPPPALMIDVGALPQAPAGSDADRIARGLPPLAQELELTEEQEKARREAMGIRPAASQAIIPPSKQKKKKNK
jgi:hypothetical protein